jgi:hypothetical protein
MDQRIYATRSYGSLTKKWSPIFSKVRNPPEKAFLATFRSSTGVQGDDLTTFLKYDAEIPTRRIEDVARYGRRVRSHHDCTHQRRAAWLDDREWNSGAEAGFAAPANTFRNYATPLTATKLCEHLKEKVRTHLGLRGSHY